MASFCPDVCWINSHFDHFGLPKTLSILHIQFLEHPIVTTTQLPSGELTSLWEITMLLMGKSTISMTIFNSKLFVYQRLELSNNPVSSGTCATVCQNKGLNLITA